ncbi:RagB/SusD family nutrient uptake outer membrane protein [Olivibacter sp. XZL3]|uniref:RagB/SusD family nutrient uptake outer membrane protein n=1 Tax=Olivibacter sp. XZL3 TaxID=1735116 RepID=UPI0010653BFB|nr:RagB/SusD family nutrient uptake outer membrane protein [Olivibacter sp. XZL3]
MKKTLNLKRSAIIVAIITSVNLIPGCKNLIEINPPTAQILASETFKDSLGVQQNLTGMYARFLNNSVYLSYSSTFPGMSADEFRYLGNTYDAFINNGLTPDVSYLDNIWSTNYAIIYIANNIISNLQTSTAVSDSFRAQALGEARFIRAFCYFHLVNYFGDVPLITETDIDHNTVLGNARSEEIYDQLVEDLQVAKANLPDHYFQSGQSRTRATTWAASALLARVYLYRQQWAEAESEATVVINNPALFELPALGDVFSSSSREAIFQFYNSPSGYTDYAAQVLPNPVAKIPTFYLTPQLVQAFEPGDARKSVWTSSVDYNGTEYVYANKYTSLATGANAEYYTALRLAEQYLIRAESRAALNNLNGAHADLNVVRHRADLPAIAPATQQETLAAIAQEKRIEFNCEWGHRWFDLKRTHTADAVLSTLKPTWTATAVLYPIPLTQIQLNNNLQQNQGY